MWNLPNIGPTVKFQQLKFCCWPNVSTATTHQRWFLLVMGQWWPNTIVIFADCYRVIFLNIVRFRLILQFRIDTCSYFSENENAWMSRKIKSWKLTFLRPSFCGTSFLLPNLCLSNTQATQTNVIQELHVGLADSSFIWNTSAIIYWKARIHFLVFCIQRIILLSLVIFVDHGWNGSVGVLWLDSFSLPLCPGLR